MKAKAKVYAENKRNAKHSALSPGDKVLVKQEQQNKLSTPFAPEGHEVVTKTGNSIIESPEGVQHHPCKEVRGTTIGLLESQGLWSMVACGCASCTITRAVKEKK